MSPNVERASELYRQNFNCAQAILAGFSSRTGLDEERSLRLASSFGGGMGNLKEVCGALTGAFMVAGLMKGFTEATRENKREHSKVVDRLAAAFKEKFDCIHCRDLLERNQKDGSAQTEAKPCLKFVVAAATLVEDMIFDNQAQ